MIKQLDSSQAIMNISRNKSEISSRYLANEATVFTVKHVQRGIEQRQTGFGRPGCRPVTPTESRPLVHRRRVGSYFHALDAALVLLAYRWQRNIARINPNIQSSTWIDTIALIVNYVFMVVFPIKFYTYLFHIYRQM